MDREKIIKKALLKLSDNFGKKDLDLLLEAKKQPGFNLGPYITKAYDTKAPRFLVWLLEEINLNNRNIIPHAKWIVPEVRTLKGDHFVRDHISLDVLQKLGLSINVF